MMMPQQTSVFHQPVLPDDESHLDNNRVVHFSSSLDLYCIFRSDGRGNETSAYAVEYSEDSLFIHLLPSH